MIYGYYREMLLVNHYLRFNTSLFPFFDAKENHRGKSPFYMVYSQERSYSMVTTKYLTIVSRVPSTENLSSWHSNCCKEQPEPAARASLFSLQMEWIMMGTLYAVAQVTTPGAVTFQGRYANMTGMMCGMKCWLRIDI